MSNSAVFYPIKANIGWFSSRDSIARLRENLKLMVLFHDKLLLEEIAYRLETDGVQGSAFTFPNKKENLIPVDSLSIGGMRSVSISLEGDSQKPETKNSGFQFEAKHDFFASFLYVKDLIDEINSHDEIIRGLILNPEFEPVAKKFSEAQLCDDLRDLKLADKIDLSDFFHKQIRKNYYFYLAYSQQFKIPMMLDDIHLEISKYYASKNALRTIDMGGSFIERGTLDAFIKLYLPSFETKTVDELFQYRKDKAFQDIGRFLKKAQQRAIKSSEDIESIVPISALEEIKEFVPSKERIVLNLFTGLIPLGHLASLGLDVKDLVQAEYHWSTFVLNNHSNIEKFKSWEFIHLTNAYF